MREHSRGRHDVFLVAADACRAPRSRSTPVRSPHGVLRRIGLIAAVVLWASTSACATLLHGRTNPTQTSAKDAWPSSLTAAKSLALKNKFGAADSVLAR